MMKAICFGMAALMVAAPATAQSSKRSGMGPCRQGALALIAMLDDKQDASAEYRHAYEAVVQTCGPAKATGRLMPAQERGACRELALGLLDTIEDGKMNTQDFARARDVFARSCAPR